MAEITVTIKDPGLGVVAPATSTPLVIGPCSGGSNNVFESFNSIPDLLVAHPQGSAVEDAAYILSQAGGPIRFMKMATSVAAANSSVTASGAGPTVSVAGSPLDDYESIVTIVTGGALGAGTFKYTLDNGFTVSETFTIPAGGTYVLANTGLTLTFAAGTYVATETYTFSSTAAMWNSTDLGNAMTAITADFTPWDFLVCSGRHATASAAATLGAALQTHLNTLTTSYRYARAIVDAGDDTVANVQTAQASVVGNRVNYVYRGQRRSSLKPFVGWGAPLLGISGAFGCMAARAVISTDLARYASGPIPGTVGNPEHDEEKLGSLDSHKISTLRTFPGGVSGVFIKNARLKAAAGSDFQFWQFGRVMDVAARNVYLAQLPFLNSGVRTVSSPVGGIDERDAIRIEGQVTAALEAVLLQPNNAEGVSGHVSALSYTIDRTFNVQANQAIKAELAIVPLGYAKAITVTVGYTTALAAAAA